MQGNTQTRLRLSMQQTNVTLFHLFQKKKRLCLFEGLNGDVFVLADYTIVQHIFVITVLQCR